MRQPVRVSVYQLLRSIVDLEALLNVEQTDTDTLVQLQQVLQHAYKLSLHLARGHAPRKALAQEPSRP